jgi:hypothetical protein
MYVVLFHFKCTLSFGKKKGKITHFPTTNPVCERRVSEDVVFGNWVSPHRDGKRFTVFMWKYGIMSSCKKPRDLTVCFLLHVR